MAAAGSLVTPSRLPPGSLSSIRQEGWRNNAIISFALLGKLLAQKRSRTNVSVRYFTRDIIQTKSLTDIARCQLFLRRLTRVSSMQASSQARALVRVSWAGFPLVNLGRQAFLCSPFVAKTWQSSFPIAEENVLRWENLFAAFGSRLVLDKLV